MIYAVTINAQSPQLTPETRQKLAVAAARREAAADSGDRWATPDLKTRLYHLWWQLLGPGSRP